MQLNLHEVAISFRKKSWDLQRLARHLMTYHWFHQRFRPGHLATWSCSRWCMMMYDDVPFFGDFISTAGMGIVFFSIICSGKNGRKTGENMTLWGAGSRWARHDASGNPGLCRNACRHDWGGDVFFIFFGGGNVVEHTATYQKRITKKTYIAITSILKKVRRSPFFWHIGPHFILRNGWNSIRQ